MENFNSKTVLTGMVIIALSGLVGFGVFEVSAEQFLALMAGLLGAQGIFQRQATKDVEKKVESTATLTPEKQALLDSLTK